MDNFEKEKLVKEYQEKYQERSAKELNQVLGSLSNLKGMDIEKKTLMQSTIEYILNERQEEITGPIGKSTKLGTLDQRVGKASDQEASLHTRLNEVYPEEISFEIYLATKYLRKRQNAEGRGVTFDLKLSDMRRLLKRKTCYYTQITMNEITESPHQRTIERLDSSLGYTKENTVACTSLANDIKNELLERPNGRLRIDIKSLVKMVKVLESH